ncbi:radical SAM protein [Cytophagales bacterium LB-30]|uniref:Radical SAM protein n=1 Tax=Shiella aurantiaca TaxID=3058365 RepID=A0ABT8F5M1_9BACT|nr:radical SAM protein [Shiella aurantiaca]MDN4165683.1 radical SAM protein [Shiella aurantiaca]
MRLIKHPVLCNYYLTYRCNATCSFCDIWERPSPYATVENVRQNLLDLKRLGVKVIDFTGGEPLLHREMDVLLRMAKEMGFITTLTTNALLYPKWAERIRGLVDMLHFSLDSADKSTHDTMRGVPCFDFVMESIQIARRLGERPDILFTVFEKNVDEIEAVYREISYPNQLVLLLNPVFDYNQVATGGGLSEASLQQVEHWAAKPLVYCNQAFIELRRKGGNRTNKPVCKAGSSTVVISPENNLVLPCYHLGLKELPIEGKLWEVYRSAEAQKLIALEGRAPGCEGCMINCYMQPSFAVEMNRYWWQALPSTLKYNRIKGTWKQMLPF